MYKTRAGSVEGVVGPLVAGYAAEVQQAAQVQRPTSQVSDVCASRPRELDALESACVRPSFNRG